MVQTAEPIDEVFRALAAPARRRLLEALSRGPASVTQLAAPFDMALPSLMQHLRALTRGGLVRSRKQGRVRTFELVPRRLELAQDWLSRQRSLWERRLNQLDDYLLNLKKGKP